MQYIVITLIPPVTPQTEWAARWSPASSTRVKTTFQDLINALRSISPVQFSDPPPTHHLPKSSASSYTGILKLAKWHMKKVKTERLNVKMGHSTPAAYLMHISLLSTRWRHFSTQLFTAKSKYTQKKRNFQSFYIKPRNAMPPVCCWAWTQKALFTIFFCLFPTVLYCNCVKLKYAPCCVVSSLCPNDLICEKTHRAWRKVEKVSGFVPRQVSKWSLYQCWEWIFSHHLPAPPPAPCLVQHMFQSTKKQQQVLLVN